MQGVDARIFADLHDPADPAVAADGSGLVVAARQTVADDELDIAVVRTHRRRPGSPETPGWYVIEADTFWLAEGSQPAWEARRAPLPALADGSFERRSRVRGVLRGRTLTLVNGNRFWVTARVRRRTVRLRPSTRRRSTVRRVARGRPRAPHPDRRRGGSRRAIRVRSLSA